MYEKLLTIFSSSELLGTISARLDVLNNVIDGYLSGIDNLRMASIILMILALIMFLFLIIIIYIKTILAFLRNDQPQESGQEEDDIFDEEDQQRLNQIIEDQERERELEKELQKELELAQAERDMNERQKEQEKAHLAEAESRKKEEKKRKEKENKEKATQKPKEKEPIIDLDWKKGKTLAAEMQNIALKPDILSYQQSNRQLNELMGLILDMIGRGVDDLKIAQTIMFRNHYMSSEEDILQLVDAIKDFIGLCRENEFSQLSNLPAPEDALLHIAEGDPTLALAMIESLMDYNIDHASAPGMEQKKEVLYQAISRQATAFGNLAAVNDVMLATGAFELAIELAPQNVAAWSRLADMYARADSTSKAIWAYQNVLNLADGELNAREVANAGKNLSQHLYAQGNSLQAAKLYNSSKQYYDALGINRRLDKQELEIVEIIESHHQDEIRSTVLKLLGRDGGQGFSF